MQVLRDLGHKDVALASMHSISKGFYGECGRRGGYTELVRRPLHLPGTSERQFCWDLAASDHIRDGKRSCEHRLLIMLPFTERVAGLCWIILGDVVGARALRALLLLARGSPDGQQRRVSR